MRFGEKLKALREAAGVTQTGLADRSGVPIGTIRDYEQTKRDPLLSTAVKLARALGVSVEVFSDCVDDVEAASRPRPAKRVGDGKGTPGRGRKPGSRA